ncbi:complement C3-like [Centruroides vittatus]|uniref:complement C3-like n=1 Tax=Centruroides vittatus TaxID=120091 RepID=UPI00350F9478
MSIIAYNVPVNEVIDVTIKDYPGMTKVFSSQRVALRSGIPVYVYINLRSKELLKYVKVDNFGRPHLYVFVEAKIGRMFKATKNVAVDYGKDYVFLQTNKPIYNPKQTVHIRVIALNEKLFPVNYKVRIQIKNPQNIIVKNNLFTEPWKQSSGQFPKINFTLPSFPLLGEWKIEASYGIQFQEKTSVSFNVEEFTLPTFAVKLRVPNAILFKDEKIDVIAHAEYVYGKKVNGNAECKLNIVMQNKNILQAGIKTVTVKDGEAKISLSTAELLKQSKLKDFPQNSKLSINVSVTDEATGIRENAKEERIKVFTSPYLLSLKYMKSHYIPGIAYEILANIVYLNGKPATNIPVSVRVTNANNRHVNIQAKTDKNGDVFYRYASSTSDRYLQVTVTTNDSRYKSGQQATETRRIYQVYSRKFIAVSRDEGMWKQTVLVRGKIQFMTQLHSGIIGKLSTKKYGFYITAEMSQVVGVLTFMLVDKELFVDSMRIEVNAKCQPKSEVIINSNFSKFEPGGEGKFILKGQPKTKVGLFAVDKALYSLRDEHRFTKEKMFKRIAQSDYGYGSGDTMNALKILSDAGVVVFGNFQLRNTNGYSIGNNHLKMSSFKPQEDDVVIDNKIDKSKENDASNRSDFGESWLFEDFEIGHNGISVVNTRLPDRITTWMIQAVSVSHTYGMCVTDVKEIKLFKRIFLQLNIPYSVVRNEQLDLQATVFNYFPQKIPVTVYMYGVKNLHSGVKEGEKSEQKNITVEHNSTVTVHFSIVPLVAQDYFIRVVAFSPYGGDTVVRKLHVVTEGVTEEMNYVITLDPRNQQNRKSRNIVSDILSDITDTSKQLQKIKFSLKPGKTYIPGSGMAVISFFGTEYGPTAQALLLDPQYLIRMPTGSCEQTMSHLGPPLYTLNFLKSRGKIDLQTERKLRDFMAEGYRRALTFRKQDGSFTIWPHKPSSIWLTSFVTKLFCQASKLIYIDENVIFKAIQWIISKQNSDGSFEDPYPVIRRDTMHGSDGKVSMTAFVLTVLQECKCSSLNMNDTQLRAKAFLEKHYEFINDPYVMALTAYALAVTNSQKKLQANEKLLKMSVYDKGLNHRYWDKSSKTESIEMTSFGLSAQLELRNMSTSLSIVNWLNKQRLDNGFYSSTQTTVIAFQALSQYLIPSTRKDISLTCKISTSHNKELVRTVQINNENAFVLQQLEINKLNGMLYINVSGRGVGSLSVKLRYNVADVGYQTCNYEVTVRVSKAKKQFSIQKNSIHYENENETGNI